MNIGKTLLSVFGGALPNLLAGNGLGMVGSMSPLLQLLYRGGKGKGKGLPTDPAVPTTGSTMAPPPGPMAAQLSQAQPPVAAMQGWSGMGDPNANVYQAPPLPNMMPNIKPASGMLGMNPDRQHAMALALMRMGQQFNGGGGY